jgi:segregation and condensation protein A
MGNEFNIKTEIFEGPLDLLLSLIEKRKLFINDISLSKVADDYIGFVKSLDSLPLDQTSHFILIASTLVLIKSKSLLPELSLSYEEEQSIDDLQNQLKLHKRFKELSVLVKDRFGKNIIFNRLQTKKTVVFFAPDKRFSLDFLCAVFKNVLAMFPKVENLPKALVKKVISLEEAIVDLTDRISKTIKMSFKDFSKFGKVEKVNVIVSFLAMLELVKQGIIQVKQDKDFEDISIETNTVSVPKY